MSDEFIAKPRVASIAVKRPSHVVLAGKAHPYDERGKHLIEELHRDIRRLTASISIAFLPDYDMDTARLLVAGADLWLNMPQPPMEASGTSGMKAAFNDMASLSVLDGWWLEVGLEGVTGWAIEPVEDSTAVEAQGLYDKLEKTVLPLFPQSCADPGAGLDLMMGAISKKAYYFNSRRMMRRYATDVDHPNSHLRSYP